MTSAFAYPLPDIQVNDLSQLRQCSLRPANNVCNTVTGLQLASLSGARREFVTSPQHKARREWATEVLLYSGNWVAQVPSTQCWLRDMLHARAYAHLKLLVAPPVGPGNASLKALAPVKSKKIGRNISVLIQARCQQFTALPFGVAGHLFRILQGKCSHSLCPCLWLYNRSPLLPLAARRD